VELLERVILTSLEKHRPGLTLKELIDAVASAVVIGHPIPWCSPCSPSKDISIAWKSKAKSAHCAGRGR